MQARSGLRYGFTTLLNFDGAHKCKNRSDHVEGRVPCSFIRIFLFKNTFKTTFPFVSMKIRFPDFPSKLLCGRLSITGNRPTSRRSSVLNICSFNFEDNRSGRIVATSDHNLIIIHPSVHNRSALESGINISADSIPRFRAKRNTVRPTVHRAGRDRNILIGQTALYQRPCAHMPIIIPLTVPVKNKFISHIVARTLSAVWSSAIQRL